MDISQYEKQLLKLIKCSVLDDDNIEIPQEIDTNKLIEIASLHKVSNIIYPLLASKKLDNNRLLVDYNLTAIIESEQNKYLEKIKERFENAKIRFVCMKGAHLRTLYPKQYMRFSSDLDIFVDDENTDKVKEIMIDLGFTGERFSHEMQDDSYIIGKFVHIEIHRKLISNKCPWDEKCQDIVNRLVPKSENSYEYVMTDEDFYLYMLGHMAKHMKYTGFGIRMVVDVWVYLLKLKDKLDRNLLNDRLKECGLYTFDKEILRLIDFWFNGENPSKKTIELSDYIFSSGVFGNMAQYLATEMGDTIEKNGSKTNVVVKKFRKAMLLPYQNMCLIYPNLSGKKPLLPIYWVIRAFDVIINKKDKITKMSKSYDNVDVNYAKQISKMKKGLGL